MKDLEILRLERVPVYQNKMYATSSAAIGCPRGDVVLAQDPQSGIVSNVRFDESKLVYDESYQNEQGHSATFQNHLDDVLRIIQTHFHSSSILEVGCGKGLFLNHLRRAGLDAWGVDPAYEGDSPFIVKAAFNPALRLQRDAIIMRHVLEHIASPISFLDSVRLANGNQGAIYIEVPSLEWIIQRKAWFDVFYEHVNYFRLDDFRRLFGRLFDCGTTFGGQYLYAVADLASLRSAPHLLAPESVALPSDFFGSLQRCIESARPEVPHVVWGCGAKGVMFSHHAFARGLRIDFAVDLNPAKQGRFLAGSGLLVASPEGAIGRLDREADIFVMNSNYLDEIQSAAGLKYKYIPLDRI